MSVLKLLAKRNIPEEDLASSESDSESQKANAVDKDDAKEDDKEEVEESAFKEQTDKQWKNRCRVLIISGRGSAPGFRHLIKDFADLLPHSKKEGKVNKKTAISDVLEQCESLAWNSFLYFEPRKNKDVYLWIGKYPHGPSAKFEIKGVNTSGELKMTGNWLKGSRPLLSFDAAFYPSEQDILKNKHLVVLKELLVNMFNTPRYHPKSKPFVDHIFSFKNFDDRIWFRNYQIINELNEKFTEKDQNEHMNLVEIGPRFSMLPVKILEGCFTGETLWQNGKYITPSKLRSKKFNRYVRRREQKEKRWKTLEENQLEVTPMDRLYEDDK